MKRHSADSSSRFALSNSLYMCNVRPYTHVSFRLMVRSTCNLSHQTCLHEFIYNYQIHPGGTWSFFIFCLCAPSYRPVWLVCLWWCVVRVEAQPAPALPANNDEISSAARCTQSLLLLFFAVSLLPGKIFCFFHVGFFKYFCFRCQKCYLFHYQTFQYNNAYSRTISPFDILG